MIEPEISSRIARYRLWRWAYMVMFMILACGLFMIGRELNRGTVMSKTIIGMVDSLRVVTYEVRAASARSDSNRVLLSEAVDSMLYEVRRQSALDRIFQKHITDVVSRKVDEVQATVDSVQGMLPPTKNGKKK